MTPELKAILRKDFASFHRKSFQTLNAGKKLGHQPYLEHLCFTVEQLARGKLKRLVVNMPPRHLKTFTASVCGPAWMLAREPSTKIMILTNSESLAKEIAFQIREIVQAPWYKEIFATRLAKGRTSVLDFVTTAGGGVFAAPIWGSITGRGADVIIVDDPLQIEDASDPDQIDEVNDYFTTVVESRLDDPARGRVMIIAHRLHEEDLSGHILAQGGWKHLSLPLIATKKVTCETSGEPWHRKKGELLRPEAFSAEKVKALRMRTRSPNFETLYQQNPSGGFRPIKRKYFQSFHLRPTSNLPVVLSIDPGQAGGPGNSFSVIQAWCQDGDRHLLIDQWRQQCTYRDLRSIFRAKFIKRYRPSAVVIEMTGQGPSLYSEIRPKNWMQLIPVTPSDSKIGRLAEHIDLIEAGRIFLPDKAKWREEFIGEFELFPKGEFTDQIDATTQYLDFMRHCPHLQMPPPRAIGFAVGRLSPFRTPSLQPRRSSADKNAMGVIALGSSRW
jgi:predicted phage terminase large subunit-like protein